MDELLSLAIESGAAGTTVRVAGEIDLASVPELRECLYAVAGDVLLDMSDVSFLDSQGLGFLVGEHGRALAAASVSSFVASRRRRGT